MNRIGSNIDFLQSYVPDKEQIGHMGDAESAMVGKILDEVIDLNLQPESWGLHVFEVAHDGATVCNAITDTCRALKIVFCNSLGHADAWLD